VTLREGDKVVCIELNGLWTPERGPRFTLYREYEVFVRRTWTSTANRTVWTEDPDTVDINPPTLQDTLVVMSDVGASALIYPWIEETDPPTYLAEEGYFVKVEP
jgi:hypothetical protein